MNTNNIINCMYDDLKCVQVRFNDNGNQYTYKTFDDYQVGDFCIVESPHNGYVVVEVVGNDPTKLEDNYRYKWVVQKVDDSNYKEINEKENEAVAKLSQMIRKNSIEKARAKVLELVGSEQMLLEVKNTLS